MGELESIHPIEGEEGLKGTGARFPVQKGTLPTGQTVSYTPTARLMTLFDLVQKGAFLISSPEGGVSAIEKKDMTLEVESHLRSQAHENEVNERMVVLFQDAFKSAKTGQEIKTLDALAHALAENAIGVFSNEKFLSTLPTRISELKSSALKALREAALRRAEASGRVRSEVVSWVRDNWDRIATPEGFPKPLKDHEVKALKGVKYYTDPTTGKVVIDIAGRVIGHGLNKAIKSVIRILPDGSIAKLVRYAPIKETEQHVPLSEEAKKEKKEILQREMTGQIGFGKPVSGGELYWRERLRADWGEIPETITDIRTITYTGKDGVLKTRYFSEQCEGDVYDLIFSDPPDIPRIQILLRDALQGLDFIHKSDIVHSDVKPENILYIGNEGKITDFGLARDSSSGSTQMGGTCGYAAPEAFFQQTISQKADIFSIGIILSLLFEPNQETLGLIESAEDSLVHAPTLAAQKQAVQELKDRIEDSRAFFDRNNELQKLAIDCLSWDPKDRPSSEEVLARLEEILRKEGLI